MARNLRPSLRFLVEEAGVPRARAGALICKAPGVLGLSVDSNLRCPPPAPPPLPY